MGLLCLVSIGPRGCSWVGHLLQKLRVQSSSPKLFLSYGVGRNGELWGGVKSLNVSSPSDRMSGPGGTLAGAGAEAAARRSRV